MCMIRHFPHRVNNFFMLFGKKAVFPLQYQGKFLRLTFWKPRV